MFCTKCGSEIKPGNKFCVKCGAPVMLAVQKAPETPKAPVTPTTPEAPKAPVTPAAPTTPETPKVPVMPAAGQSAGTAPGNQKTPETPKKKAPLVAILVGIIVVLVLAIGGTAAYLILNRDAKEQEQDWEADEDEPADRENAVATENTELVTETTETEEAAAAVNADEVLAAVEAYQDYMQTNMDVSLDDGLSYSGYALVNVDEDTIPELFWDSGIYAYGMLLLTYSNGRVHENYLASGGFSYLEYQNKMLLSYGHMDVYGDSVCHLQDGTLLADQNGEYGLSDNTQVYDADGNEIPYEYSWEGQEMSEEEYQKKLSECFDVTSATPYQTYGTLADAFSAYCAGVPELQGLQLSARTNGDILPTSSTEYLTIEQIEPLTDEQLRLARNEIYARHGYTFQDEELRAYFEAKPWYEATVTDVQDTDLNEYEIANRDLIKQVEDSRK